MQVRQELPNRLRELRKEHGIRPAELAAAIDRDVGTLNRYETGETNIPDEIKLALAERFDVSVSHLMRWDEN